MDKTFNETAVKRIERIKTLIEATMSEQQKERRCLYIHPDDRGMVFGDNYDNIWGAAIIVTHEGDYIGHSCAEGWGYSITTAQAERYAKRFFTTAGDALIGDAIDGVLGERLY
jgi:hypothetical protein